MDQGLSMGSPPKFNVIKRRMSIHEEDSDCNSKKSRTANFTPPSTGLTTATSTSPIPLSDAHDDSTMTNSWWATGSENNGFETETWSPGPWCKIFRGLRAPDKSTDPTDSICRPDTLDGEQDRNSAIVNSVDTIFNRNGPLSGVSFNHSSISDSIEKRLESFQYSACFGVLVINATSSFTSTKGGTSAPVRIQKSGDILKLKALDGDKYAGVISSPVLGQLLDEFSVKLSATLELPPPSTKASASQMAKLDRPRGHTVRIVIYGLKNDRFVVGNMLSEAGLFLQQPSATECERDIEYCNPHYLVRPGSQMPKLNALSISSDIKLAATSELLDEVNKHRFMRIFDTAHDMGIRFQIRPSERLASTLKDHQLTALAMMAEKEYGIVDKPTFPSIWELKPDSGTSKRYRHKVTGHSDEFPNPVHGGVLADDMGLGKTLSLLALICSSLDIIQNEGLPSHQDVSRATLVVAPKSTIPGWQQQIIRHIKSGQLHVAVYHGSTRRNMATSFNSADIVLTTYETLRSDWVASGPLYSENWYRLVLDEAHHIRNRSSQTFKAACAVSCQYRWCLTGTPIQNSLDDFGALLSFIGVSPFTEKSMFDYWITSPIKAGKPENFKRLQTLVKATCLRRTKRNVGLSLALPQRIEEIEHIDLYTADQGLYDFFKTKTAKIAAGIASSDESALGLDQTKENKILVLINFLRLICNHGTQLLPESAVQAWKMQDSSLVNWQLMQSCTKKCDMCKGGSGEPELLSAVMFYSKCGHSICEACAIGMAQNGTEDERTCPKCVTKPEHGILAGIQSPTSTVPSSAKIEVLLRNLQSEQGHRGKSTPERQAKSVIFSYWTKMLDLVQQAVASRGFNFQRIDGATSLEGRRKALCKFNEDPECTIMLASIGSAGEGVDLTVANHVHLIEPHWNPMAEAQAVDRVHRIGQVRDVVIKRYIVRNSIETYIQWVQQHKMKLISRSLDSTDVSQSDLDDERWKNLRLHLGHATK